MKSAASKKTIIAICVLSIIPIFGFATDCVRTNMWRCRTCGWMNPISVRYCRRDHADLEEQRRRFRQSIAPVFQVTPVNTVQGKSVVLQWYTSCTTRVTIEPNLGVVPAFGMLQVHPTSDTTYRLNVESDWSDWIASPAPVSVRVFPTKPLLVAYALVDRIWDGDSVTLAWAARGTAKVTLNPGGRVLPTSGQIPVTPGESTTYQFTAENEGTAPTTVEVQVEVRKKPIPPDSTAPTGLEEQFDDLAKPLLFGDRESHLAASEQAKLQPLIAFLLSHPAVKFSFTAYGYEYWDGRRGDYARHASLVRARWQTVHDYLQANGITAQQLPVVGGAWTSVAKSSLHSKQDESNARRVAFRFRGLVPSISAKIYPETMRVGESDYLVWSSAYADEVSIDPIASSTKASGAIRIDGSAKLLHLTAKNHYGFLAEQNLVLSVLPREAPPQLPPLDLATLVSDNVAPALFEPGSDVLTDSGRRSLRESALWLMDPDRQQINLTVVGYTTGSEPKTLARRRAEQAVKYLAQQGVSQSRLRIVPASASTDETSSVRPDIAQVFQRRVELAYDSAPSQPRPTAPPPKRKRP